MDLKEIRSVKRDGFIIASLLYAIPDNEEEGRKKKAVLPVAVAYPLPRFEEEIMNLIFAPAIRQIVSQNSGVLVKQLPVRKSSVTSSLYRNRPIRKELHTSSRKNYI